MAYKSIFIALLIVGYSLAKGQDSDSESWNSREVSIKRVVTCLDSSKIYEETEPRKALSFALEALEISKQLQSREYIAECNLKLGSLYDNVGINAKAIAHLQNAVSLFKNLGDRDKEISSLNLIGNICCYSEEFDLAESYYAEVVEYAKETNDTSLLITGYLNQGVVRSNTNAIYSAIVLYRKAFEFANLIKHEELEIHALFNLADTYSYIQAYKKAARVFNTLETDYELEKSYPRLYGSILNSITHVYFGIGEMDKAKKYSDKTNSVLNKYPREYERLVYYQVRYKIDSARGYYLSAIDYLNKYKSYSDKISSDEFDTRLASFETLYELEKKEAQIEQLSLDNELKDFKIVQKRFINYGFGLLTIAILFFALNAYASRKKIFVKNLELEKQKEEIQQKTEELSKKNIKLENLINELNRTQKELIQKEKMASLGTLITGVAHEINNPLNYILGGAEIIRQVLEEEKEEIPEDVIKQVKFARDMVEKGVDRSTNIVKSLLTFSYQGKPKKMPYSVNKIIDDSLIFLSGKIDSKIEITKNYTFEDKIMVFPDKLHQVVLNILDNAVFEVSKSADSTKRIDIKTVKVDEMIELRFLNNGEKIPEPKLHQIFDPFYTTKDPGKGTGLGLSICYTLIKEHDGDLSVRNVDEGVEFLISLPFKQ